MEVHKLHLTIAQKRKLLRGQAVQLKHEHLQSGGSTVVLDKMHGNKIRKAIRTAKGARIQFANEDMIHNNVIHGTGFKDLLSKAKKAFYGIHNHLKDSGAYDVLRETGKKLIHQGIDHVSSRVKQGVKNVIEDKMPEGSHANFSRYADNLIDSGVGRLHDKLDGNGIGKTERRIINGFKKAGRTIKKVVTSDVGKTILKGVAGKVIPGVLAGIQAETGVPVGVLAPVLTRAANKGIDGMGVAPISVMPSKRSRGRPRKVVVSAGALVPSGYGLGRKVYREY